MYQVMRFVDLAVRELFFFPFIEFNLSYHYRTWI